MKYLPNLNNRWQHKRPGEIVLLDNRDSFVFNLAHRFAEIGQEVVVHRSDAVRVEEIGAWKPRALVLSPGPGHPDEAGISVAAVRRFSGEVPILGICLGHQAIICAFGGQVAPNQAPMHGKASRVEHAGDGIFAGLAQPLEAGRYHSLVAEETLPEVLEVTARADGFVMGVAHRKHPTFGVQFHPESVLTPQGRALLENFIKMCVDVPPSSAALR